MSGNISNAIVRLSQAFTACSFGEAEKRLWGERELNSMAADYYYPMYLLHFMITDTQVDQFHKLRAAIEFKKWAKSDWIKPNLQDIEFSEVHIEIKNSIVKVYTTVGDKEAELILEAILSIAKWEYSHRWENLSTDLMGSLDPNNLSNIVNYRVFKCLSKLMTKYEHSARSDPLSLEVLHSSKTTAEYLFYFADKLIGVLTGNLPNDIQSIKSLLTILKFVVRSFYYLNCQDIPPEIDNKLGEWMQVLSKTLTLNLNAGDQIKIYEFKCKGESLRSIILYFTKYREDVASLVETFSLQVYEACMSLSDDDSNNKFVLNAMKYFKNLLYWGELRDFFGKEVEKLILTLIFKMEKPTVDDKEVFDTEPEGFIENVFNNAGGSSRKNITHDLAKAISKYFKDQATPVLQKIVGDYASAFQTQSNPMSEITIINLLIDMGVQAFTPKFGVTETLVQNEFFTYFFDSVVEPLLKAIFQASKQPNYDLDASINLFHVAHLIRFVFFFRNLLDKVKLLDLIKDLSSLLKVKDETFKRVLYYAIENLIIIKEIQNPYQQSPFLYNKNNETVFNYVAIILENIYHDIKGTAMIDAYQVKTLFNIIKILDDSCSSLIDAFADLFKVMIQKIYDNYNFNTIYVVFDSLATLMVQISQNSDAVNKLTGIIFPVLNEILLAKKNTDLISYAFQIYALAIHFYNINSSDPKTIFLSVMDTGNWNKDNSPMFPAYMMFIEEFINKDVKLLAEYATQIQFILETVLDCKQEGLFFSLATTIVLNLSADDLRNSGLLNTILVSILKSLYESQQNNPQKDGKLAVRGSLAKGILVFFSLCISKLSFEGFLNDVNNSFGGNIAIFYQFLCEQAIIIRNYQRQPERKVIINGMLSIVFSSVWDKIPQDVWAILLNAVVENLIRKKTNKLGAYDPDDAMKQGITMGSTTNFQKLSWFKTQKIQYSDLPDEDIRFVNEFSNKFANNASEILQNIIDQKNQAAFQKLFQS